MREDRVISALIGLVGACNNNPKTADTDSLVIKALAFLLLCPEYDDEALREIVEDIYSEKKAVAPGCAGLLDEAEKIEYDIKSGGIQNDQKDYKN